MPKYSNNTDWFFFFCRSRTLLSARRTCLRRRRCCAGPRRRPTSTPESTCRTSPSHGGMGSPSMPSSTETGESVFCKSKMLRRGSLLSASRRLPQKLLSRKWPIQRPPNLSHYLPLLLLNVTITPKLGRVTISNLSLRPPGNLVRCCSFLDAPGFKLAALAMCCRLVLIPYFGVGAAFDAKFWCWGYFWCHILVLLALLMPYFGVTGSLDPIFCPLIANCQT